MPANDVYLANLRADGHKVRLFYGKFDGSVVLNATVSATPADQARDLSITVVSGSAASVRRGWLVRVETAGGLFKGITNVRAAGTISATNLPIHELGQSDIAIVSGDVLKVYNLPYLGDKIPTDDASFAPDNLTYVDQATAVPPRVNSGGHYIGMVDAGLTYATVPLPGVSTAEDPDSGGSLTYVTTLLTGTLAFAPGSVSTDANPTLRASVGYGIAERVVTDSSNSKSWTQYVCTQVYNDANPPYRLIDAELSADEASGWSGTLQTYAYSGLSDLYDGQFGGVFARETINGVTISYGSDVPNRSQIKLLGFLSRDENDLQPQIRRVHLTLQSPWQRLASLPGFSKVFTRGAADWTGIDGLTVRLALLHLIRYYSFFMEFFDVRFDSAFLNKAWSKYYLNKQTADQQIRELADGVDARVVSLRTGEMLIHTHPALIPLASRAAVTTTLTVAERDCLSAPFTRDHWKVIETFELRGFIAGTADNATVFSRSPGKAPGRGAQSLAAERVIADDQTDANERSGRRHGRADGSYFNSSGVYTRAVEWDVTLPGSYDLFDFNKEYIQTSLTGTSNLREVDLSAQRYYLSRMRIRYQGGTARVNPTFLTATNAPAGATYVPPTENLPPYTPGDLVPEPGVPPLLISTLTYGDQIAAITDTSYLLRTSDFTAAAPGWTKTLLTSAPYNLVGTPFDWVPDAFSPLYLGTGTEVNGKILTTLGIYAISDIFGTPTVSAELTYATQSSGTLQMERSTPGLWVAHLWLTGGGGGSQVRYTLDNGATWNTATGVPATTSASPHAPVLYIDAHGGSVRAVFFASAGVTAGYVFNPATGAWTAAGSPNFALGDTLAVWLTAAYADPNTFYTFSAAPAVLKVSGAAQTDVSPLYLGTPYGVTGAGARALRIDDAAPTKAAILARTSKFATDTGLWIAGAGISAPASWSNVIVPNNANYAPLASLSIVYPVLFAYGLDHIEVIDMDTLVRTDKSNNLTTGSSGTLINICGGQ